LLAAQSTVPRLTSVESAPRLALDQVTAEARPTGIVNEVARVTLDKAKKEASFSPDRRERRRTLPMSLDQLRAVYDAFKSR
jgi:hypothetical protein